MRARPDACLMFLSERDNLLPGLIAVDFGSRDEGRTFGAIKRRDDLVERVRIGAQCAADLPLCNTPSTPPKVRIGRAASRPSATSTSVFI